MLSIWKKKLHSQAKPAETESEASWQTRSGFRTRAWYREQLAVGRRWQRLSMRWQIFLWFLGFALAILILFWLFQTVYLNTIYQRIKITQVEDACQDIATNLDTLSEEDNLVAFAQENEACVSIYAVHHIGYLTALTEVQYADVTVGCIIHDRSRFNQDYFSRLYASAVENGGAYQQAFTPSDYTGPSHFGEVVPRSLVYALLTENQEGREFMVIVNSSITPMVATIQTLRIQLLYISIIVIVLSLVLSFVIARNLSLPISRINSTAQELAKGNFQIEFQGAGCQETAQLSDTLNYATQELSRSEKLQQELIANISHDLRTPLTMIRGYAEVMRDLPEENSSENLSLIIDEAERLNSLVNDVLDMSKLGAGVSQLTLETYDFSAAVSELVARYNALLNKDGYQITLSLDGQALVHADKTRISQVISNLLNNAITYTGEDKQVHVEQHIQGKRVRLDVVDNGVGIEADQLPLIWDRYYRSKNHRRPVKGSGLGLSIVRDILNMHDAEYGVDSKVGQGSRFWFSLPLATPEDSTAAAPSARSLSGEAACWDADYEVLSPASDNKNSRLRHRLGKNVQPAAAADTAATVDAAAAAADSAAAVDAAAAAADTAAAEPSRESSS